MDNMPHQLQKIIDPEVLRELEMALPAPLYSKGKFRYYNSFLCPHCQVPFIDFDKNMQIRRAQVLWQYTNYCATNALAGTSIKQEAWNESKLYSA